MIRFLENHDEPRAGYLFTPRKNQCAMIIHASLPGMKLWQHGQLEGNQIRVPVQLRRGPIEKELSDLSSFSGRLLYEVDHPVFHNGKWEICDITGWPDNQSHENLLAWRWSYNGERRLIIVNISDSYADGLVTLPMKWLPREKQILFYDPLKYQNYLRESAEIANSGLYVRLDKYDYHFFKAREI